MKGDHGGHETRARKGHPPEAGLPLAEAAGHLLTWPLSLPGLRLRCQSGVGEPAEADDHDGGRKQRQSGPQGERAASPEWLHGSLDRAGGGLAHS